MINIKGLDKIKVLEVLYENARPLGMGYFHFQKGPLPEETKQEIKKVYETTGKFPYVDYLLGRVMKVDLSKDEFDERLYERDNGEQSALRTLGDSKLLVDKLDWINYQISTTQCSLCDIKADLKYYPNNKVLAEEYKKTEIKLKELEEELNDLQKS